MADSWNIATIPNGEFPAIRKSGCSIISDHAPECRMFEKIGGTIVK